MATKPKAEAKQEFVSVVEFNKLTSVLETLVSTVTELKNRPVPTVAETKEEVEIKKAKPDHAPIPESWEESAREILGEMLDHVELLQPRGGGTLFTVVIKPEFSNAPKEYLERHKLDRRTKEIGNEGISGVEAWCKLVRSNIKKFQQK